MGLKFGNMFFFGFIIIPMLLASAEPLFIYSPNYIILFITILAAWLFGQLIIIFAPKKTDIEKINLSSKFEIMVYSSGFSHQKLFKILIWICIFISFFLIIYFGNIGLVSEYERLKFEGSIQQKTFLLSVFLYSIVYQKQFFIFLLLFVLGLLSGWKSNVLYAIISRTVFSSSTSINITKVLYITLFVFLILFIFAITNGFRQDGRVSSSEIYHFFTILKFYILYGFVNLSNNLANIPTDIFIYGGNIPIKLVIPTWNVFSGAFYIISNFGIFGCFLFFFFLPFLCVWKLKGQKGHFLVFCLICFFVLFHNSFFLQSKIIYAFMSCLFILDFLSYISSSKVSTFRSEPTKAKSYG